MNQNLLNLQFGTFYVRHYIKSNKQNASCSNRDHILKGEAGNNLYYRKAMMHKEISLAIRIFLNIKTLQILHFFLEQSSKFYIELVKIFICKILKY